MKKKYRCIETVNRIVDWNAEKKEKYILELKPVQYEKTYIIIRIKENKSKKELVNFIVKRKGNLMIDIRINERIPLIEGYKQRVLRSRKDWLRIECGFDKVADLLSQLDENSARIRQSIKDCHGV